VKKVLLALVLIAIGVWILLPRSPSHEEICAAHDAIGRQSYDEFRVCLDADDPYACDDHEKHSAIAQQLWERCWYGMTPQQQAQWKRDHPQ
jgi:hypothetical protein